MNLHPEATEYAHIPMTGVPADAAPLEVSFDGGKIWNAATWNTDKTEATILISGPQGTGGGVVLAGGRNTVIVRLVDTPERIIRKAGGFVEVQ